MQEASKSSYVARSKKPNKTKWVVIQDTGGQMLMEYGKET